MYIYRRFSDESKTIYGKSWSTRIAPRKEKIEELKDFLQFFPHDAKVIKDNNGVQRKYTVGELRQIVDKTRFDIFDVFIFDRRAAEYVDIHDAPVYDDEGNKLPCYTRHYSNQSNWFGFYENPWEQGLIDEKSWDKVHYAGQAVARNNYCDVYVLARDLAIIDMQKAGKLPVFVYGK